MSSLREWLDQQTLREEVITFRGRKLLIVEIDLAERGRLFAKHASKDGVVTDRAVEALMCCACVRDPETREPVVATEDWEYWTKKGGSFSPVVSRVLALNGLKDDPVEAEVKNSDTTPG